MLFLSLLKTFPEKKIPEMIIFGSLHLLFYLRPDHRDIPVVHSYAKIHTLGICQRTRLCPSLIVLYAQVLSYRAKRSQVCYHLGCKSHFSEWLCVLLSSNLGSIVRVNLFILFTSWYECLSALSDVLVSGEMYSAISHESHLQAQFYKSLVSVLE